MFQTDGWTEVKECKSCPFNHSSISSDQKIPQRIGTAYQSSIWCLAF